MTTAKRYSLGAHTIFNIGYHLIWCTKYRRKVINEEVEIRLKELLSEKANELGVEIKTMETMPDHVHLFIKTKPTHSPHFIVQQFKGYSSRILRNEFPFLKSRIPTLWTRSYYCEAVGHISVDTILKYIEDQKKIWRFHPPVKTGSIHAFPLSKKESIKSFCRFIDTYNGEMTIRGGLIYDVNGVIIYSMIDYIK